MKLNLKSIITAEKLLNKPFSDFDLSALPGFAEGGIVPGSSFTGDKLVGRLNSGEMILNKSQQSNLWKAAQGRIAPTAQQGSPRNLKFEIEGKNLVAIFDQYATRNKRH